MWHLCKKEKKKIAVTVCVYFWDFYPVLLAYESALMTLLYYFDYNGSIFSSQVM
jgi:hypothetical protein